MKKAQNLIGLAGLFFYTFICILLSKAPYKINWRPVLWGYFTQLVLGILVLRTTAGYIAFKEDFLNHKLLRDHHQESMSAKEEVDVTLPFECPSILSSWLSVSAQDRPLLIWLMLTGSSKEFFDGCRALANKINMKSHLSGWETKLHSFYLSQTGSCSKIT